MSVFIENKRLQGAICQRLSVFGVPAVWHKQFSVCVNRWVQCSGVEWTVKRLKSLKVDLYRDHSGLPLLTPAARNGNKFKGVIGSLFKWSHKSERNFQSVVHTLMVYSLFKNHKLSDSQREKFVSAINASTYTPCKKFLEDFAIFIEHQTQGRKLKIGKPQSMLFYRGSPGKKAPVINHRSVMQDMSGITSLTYFATDAHFELLGKYPSLYGPVTEGVDLSTFKESIRSQDLDDNDVLLGGEVHFLQEPGLKLRAIASPFLVHQEALKPFGQALYQFMHTLPWDCTHDHTKPVGPIQQHLSSGKKIHSVDLSNATDYFPLEVQVKALVALIGHHPAIDLFVQISRSEWKSSIGPIRWLQGQPLGLYPSFASFGITHGYLLSFLLGKRYEGEFYVLGDDVIILNDQLYDKYKRYLGYLGCPYSPDKTISSNSLCEFAGKVITSTQVIPAYKWREVSNDNFIDLVRNYGRRAVTLLSPIQRWVVERIQHCVEPIGLNWSFPGSTREEMTRITQTIYHQMDRDEQSLTELHSTIQRNWYSVPNFQVSMLPSLLKYSIDMEYLAKQTSALDERVIATLAHVFPKEWVDAIQSQGLIGGYAGVPRAVGLSDLPLLHSIPSRVTTLDRYRNLLNAKR